MAGCMGEAMARKRKQLKLTLICDGEFRFWRAQETLEFSVPGGKVWGSLCSSIEHRVRRQVLNFITDRMLYEQRIEPARVPSHRAT